LIDLLLLLKFLKLLLTLELIGRRPALRLVELFFLPELIELLFLVEAGFAAARAGAGPIAVADRLIAAAAFPLQAGGDFV